MSDHGEHGEEAPVPPFVYPEFKAEIVELCQRGDRSVGQVAKDFDLTETAVGEWVKQAGRDSGTRTDGGLTSAEQQELAQRRFRSKDAFARFTGTAPIPVWSGSTAGKVRLNRGGNRRMNCALHMIAVTQARGIGPGKDYLDKALARGKTRTEGLRLLRRRLSDTVYPALLNDEAPATGQQPELLPRGGLT
jgi:hypothetical protein